MTKPLRLGINVDHVATIRNARGGRHPDPVRAARLAQEAGADGITAHLREDRRHIRDEDVERLKAEIGLPLNLEMAATPEMVRIATRLEPHAVCLVPERRAEITTEGGLDIAAGRDALRPVVAALVGAGIRVSLFIDPDARQIETAAALGAPVIELHTGAYAERIGEARRLELQRLVAGAALADRLGIECHAGHGLDYENVGAVAAIPEVVELNIGHFIVGEAVFIGWAEAIGGMRRAMQAGRTAVAK
ncbi:MAG TPA: pyridoxine 5'-phosphate synthase [Lichenihabitans sp.]|jgi:pyridoxine 5-phosphate synthase|nr:pyridoxine 5'-phosphate synthase [Lichenihabitans sp.]